MIGFADGSLVGVTTKHGHTFDGAAFRLVPPVAPGRPWTHTRPASFNADPEGLYARGEVALGLDGRVYGSMITGGSTWVHVMINGYGTVFSMDPLAKR